MFANAHSRAVVWGMVKEGEIGRRTRLVSTVVGEKYEYDSFLALPLVGISEAKRSCLGGAARYFR